MMRAGAALLCAACLSACGPKLVAVGAPPRLSPTDHLQQTIRAALADPQLEYATWGIAVRSLDRHDTLFALNSGKLLMPASTMKVVTLAAAAEQLGWDFEYETQLVAHGVIATGFLDGDLVIVGSGDPSIDDWDGAATRTFGTWAERLKQAGVRAVGGRIIGDDETFDDLGLGAGWAWDDLAASYATSVGALQFNENTAQVVITPGPAAGSPARVSLSPATASVTLRNLIVTVPADAPAAISIKPAPRGAAAEARGTIGLNAGPLVRNVSVDNPTMYLTAAIRDGLVAHGIDVRGPAIDIDDLTIAPIRHDGVLLISHRSAPLWMLAEPMMKMSQNLFAESLLKALGAHASGVGSADAGRAAVQATLRAWGVPPGDVQMADGSGLSRYNLLTADALVTILARVHDNDRLRQRFEHTLPIAGVDGTLAQRMAGTRAFANARAKTGSFSNARALAGYVTTADGEMLAFSIIANNYAVQPEVIDRTSDFIVIALAQFSRN
ncbi:MAG: D-alanyl-D-alanine carboxypeptidase/D-alanyl-D-alanine-endopeptidase [Luteitalea sp.]|nr:D-alanyl-D-alanine carboxypeptidase/D-alanyl-D-alanine-endopeptidase [Luteitalea sp.]